MDSCERECDYALNAELQRCECCVLSGRTLTIVLSADDEAAVVLLCSCGELLVTRCEAVVCKVRDVGSERQKLSVGRHDVVCGDVVLNLDQCLALNCVSKLVVCRERLDVRSSYYFNFIRCCRRKDYHVVVNLESVRHCYYRRLTEISRVCYYTCDGSYSSNLRAYEVDGSGLGSGSSIEVSVVCSQGYSVCLRRLTHTDTRTASALNDTCACLDHVSEGAYLSEHIEYLLGSGSDNE